MKNLSFTYSTLILLLMYSATGAQVLSKYSGINAATIAFTKNEGQVHDQNYRSRPDVLYGAMAGNLGVHIKNTGVSYQLCRIDNWKEVTDERTAEKRKEIDKQTIYRVDLNWVNANKDFTQSTDEILPGYTNFYLENCPNGALYVKSYKGITLHNIYNGIDLHYYEKNGQLKHDYIVSPHANYKQIQLKIEGADVRVKKDGSLLLITPLGNIREGAPVVFQNEKQLKAKWRVKNNNLSFDIENYDPDFEMIIDPITRLWGTYYGGSGGDYANGCSNDAAGNIFMTGITNSNSGTVIATSGSHQTSLGGLNDAFLVKFNTNGVRLWGTYYGGSANDEATAISINNSGDIFMTGSTGSTLGIATPGSHQPVIGYTAATSDAFLVKFNNNGVRLWGTYYGGGGGEYAWACATDPSGNVFMAGYTGGTFGTTVATVGSHQPNNGGGNDAFLVKFDGNGVRQWGTFYGGAQMDIGYGCTCDPSGNAYLCGFTSTPTTTLIATTGSHQSAIGSFGYNDAFLVKFDAAGVRQWGTYYGETSDDYANGCCTDPSGNVYLTGSTTASLSPTVIATPGSQQPTNYGAYDAFLVKFNGSGVRQWGTFYGGGTNDYGYACTADALGNVYFSGNTSCSIPTVIATPNSHQPALFAISDAFFVKFNSSGARQWGTFYGGSISDFGHGCSVDANQNAYLAGRANSNDAAQFTTPGSHQASWGGIADAFLVKFFDCVSINPNAGVTPTICSGSNLIFNASVSGTATPTYSWAGPNSYTSALQNPTVTNASTLHSGIFTLTVNNNGCIETATTSATVKTSPTITASNGSICIGSSFTIVPGGANTYTIQGGSAVVNPGSTTSYTVVGTSTNGCVSASSATSIVTVNPLPTITVNSGSVCIGNSFTITPNGASTYTIQGGNAIVSPSLNSTYTVAGTSTAGCTSSISATCSVNVNPNPTLSVNSGSVCSGKSFTFNALGAINYTLTDGVNLPAVFNPGIAVIPPGGTTTYTVTGINSFGCINSIVTTITAQALPSVSAVSNVSVLCTGQTATLSASGANTYNWIGFGGGPTIVVLPGSTTVYTVVGTAANGCTNTAIVTQSVDACTGFNSILQSKMEIKIYPNPGTGIFTLELPKPASLCIFDALGKLILNEKVSSPKYTVNLVNEAKGIYLLHVEIDGRKEMIRLIKQ